MPQVSVIIPNYNHARFLKQRIESVINQTYQDFEVIILDDKSTDESEKVIEGYRGHEKITHIVYNQTNSGSTFKQWKKGLELASGKYIWIAESDDYADEQLLEVLMAQFEKHPSMLISYCQSAVVDEQGNFMHLSDWADELDPNRWKTSYVEDAKIELLKYLRYRNTIPNASAVLFLKPANINIVDESLQFKMAGDWVFWKNLLRRQGLIAFNAQPLNYFRLHLQSTRVTTPEKELTRLREFKQLISSGDINPFKNHYDWMLGTWWGNRKILKGTEYYYMPDFPLLLKMRIPIYLISGKIKKLFYKFKS